jgi:hypothetical protein
MTIYENIVNLISDSEDVLFELDVAHADLLHYPKKILRKSYEIAKPAAKAVLKKAGSKALNVSKHGLTRLKEKSKEINPLDISKHKLDKVKSELYAARLAKDKNKIDLLTKKLTYMNQKHKNIQQNYINKKQKYIQKTKEIEFRIKELENSNTEPETLSILKKKYEKRKLFLNKMGVTSDE